MSENKCFLCKSKTDNDLKFGEIKKLKNISVHYFCLLLTSCLVQNGEEDEGILGFLLKDIRAEEAKNRLTKCCYCKKNYANIACCAKYCQKFFHTECGFENKCLNEFQDTFRSFCNKHVVQPYTDRHDPEESCAICFDDMGEYDLITSVLSPCCKTAWFHKDCLARYAAASGYFFKCPKCNNSDVFKEEIPNRGVFIPEKDAAWESDPNAFAELAVRPNRCEADNCKCDKGREFEETSGDWDFMICLGCGSKAKHQACLEIGEDDDIYYICTDCNGKVPQSVIELAFQGNDNETTINSQKIDEDDENDDFNSSFIRIWSKNKRNKRIESEEETDESSSSHLSSGYMKIKLRRCKNKNSKRSSTSQRRRNSRNGRTHTEKGKIYKLENGTFYYLPRGVTLSECEVLVKKVDLDPTYSKYLKNKESKNHKTELKKSQADTKQKKVDNVLKTCPHPSQEAVKTPTKSPGLSSSFEENYSPNVKKRKIDESPGCSSQTKSETPMKNGKSAGVKRVNLKKPFTLVKGQQRITSFFNLSASKI